MNCFRYLGYKSFAEVDRLTLPEDNLLMKAVSLKSVDEDLRIHKQAYLNYVATATRIVGKKEKPVYAKFKDFYDYEKELAEVLGEHAKKESQLSSLSRFLKEKERESNG